MNDHRVRRMKQPKARFKRRDWESTRQRREERRLLAALARYVAFRSIQR